jgi:methionyl-tRNA formyltransferase
VLQPARLKDDTFLASLRALDAEIGVVAAYGRILTDAVLAVPPRGMVNVHASLLPAYRGAAPVHRAVIAGEQETGVTIMRVVKELDAGPMLAAVRRPIATDETSADVERDLAALGAALLVETLDSMATGPVAEVPQEHARATYAARLTKEDGAIAWERAALRIHNLVRGLHPWPHAYTYAANQRLILLRTEAHEDDVTRAEPGTLVMARGDDLRVATATGTLAIKELQAEGKRPMLVREFLQGHRLAEGLRLTSAVAHQ